MCSTTAQSRETTHTQWPNAAALTGICKRHWAPLLGIRQLGQHARCTTCATLSKLRREHPDPDEREAAAKAYDAHLNRMFNDRRVDMRLTRLSELSTSTTSSFAGCLHVRIDGMDQSKFKCPRNIEDAKTWSSLWRPTLHLCGIIVEGGRGDLPDDG